MAESVGKRQPRFAFAGDRDVAVRVLDHLLGSGARPVALMVSGPDRASHAADLVSRCAHLPAERVFRGIEFRDPGAVRTLRELNLDLVVAVHFPYIVPAEVLEVPRTGVLNLHPAYLPYNRGWHTPSWAILEGTPVGATLHFMDRGVDSGDIVHRRQLDVSPGDTADALYARLKDLEFEVFREAWPRLVDGTFARTQQSPHEGTSHRRSDLFRPEVQRIELDQPLRGADLLRKLRALTTSRVDEAAYYEVDGVRYRVQVSIHEEPAATAGAAASDEEQGR